jgi:hypothetical protein
MHRNIRYVGRRSWRAAAVVIAVASLTACGGSQGAPVRQTDSAAAAGITAEARTFMDAYARDLLAGDRAAIGARYDPAGAYLLGNGQKDFSPYDSIVARYSDSRWSPPHAFEWRDLSFEPVGSDAVFIAGLAAWTSAPGSAPIILSYTAVLERRDGSLRIRLEDESVDPRSMPAAPPPADSAKR